MSCLNDRGVHPLFVFFNNIGSVVARLGSTDSELYNTLKILENYSDGYNTNIATALTVALDELKTSEDKNAVKSIVLISDGGTECEGDVLSYDRAVLERAKRENVRIHTVALGDNAVMDNLREIADVTGGTSFVYAFHNASYIADKVFSLPQIYGYIDVTPTVHIQEKDILGSEAYLKNLRKRSFVELSYVINYSYNIL